GEDSTYVGRVPCPLDHPGGRVPHVVSLQRVIGVPPPHRSLGRSRVSPASVGERIGAGTQDDVLQEGPRREHSGDRYSVAHHHARPGPRVDGEYVCRGEGAFEDRKSTRLNSSHVK